MQLGLNEILHIWILHSSGRNSDKQVTHLQSFLAMLNIISDHMHQHDFHVTLGVTVWDFHPF